MILLSKGEIIGCEQYFQITGPVLFFELISLLVPLFLGTIVTLYVDGRREARKLPNPIL
jgi:hypothetical protein